MAEFKAALRKKLSQEGEALPDGSFPIRNKNDLKNAISSYGRSKDPEKTKTWIKKRAKALGAEDLLPESWTSVDHSSDDYDFEHYGVLGMKWGVRRAARRDAKEMARAKMYYGEGAGTRRKLINATVKAKRKDPVYSKLFDEEFNKQDMAAAAQNARKTRNRADRKNKANKLIKNIVKSATGGTTMALLASGIVYAGKHPQQVNNVIHQGIKFANKMYQNENIQRGVRYINGIIKYRSFFK